ncbi:hypothetical protein BHU61_06550 [Macrococcus epidermidis]|uniref:Uncharacterized protein n=1 Tax=Macrococcus epidermidis TaxID=1902580 RepID=A0A327ZVC8_9STAP|nr:hypothetical protein [Macrococcus epidermidis]RAK44968.1 hypothetical protein BHU61_06550 [Macrococcus epidermidis]
MREKFYDGFILTEEEIDALNAGKEIKHKSKNGKIYLFSKQIKAECNYYDISFNLYKGNDVVTEDGLFTIYAKGIDEAIKKLSSKYPKNIVEIINYRTVRRTSNVQSI